MTSLARITAASCVAVALTLTLGTAHAQDMNLSRTTYLTFSGPVELPNLTLAAGKYTFRLDRSPGNRNIVHIYNADGTKHIGTVLAISATRNEPTGETVITFKEAPEAAPAAIQYWFYPGNVIGHEFVYPRAQAMRIARASGQEVKISDELGSTETMQTAEVRAVDREGQEREVPDEATAARAAAEQSRRAEAATGSPRTEARATGTAGARALPRTASNVPLVGLLGLLSLVSFAGVRLFSRATAEDR